MSLPEVSFVIARLSLDYLGEIFWPGTVEIGTAVKAFGNSSITFTQALFQNGKCVSTAESVVVQVDNRTRRSTPLSAEAREKLQALVLRVSETGKKAVAGAEALSPTPPMPQHKQKFLRRFF